MLREDVWTRVWVTVPLMEICARPALIITMTPPFKVECVCLPPCIVAIKTCPLLFWGTSCWQKEEEEERRYMVAHFKHFDLPVVKEEKEDDNSRRCIKYV